MSRLSHWKLAWIFSVLLLPILPVAGVSAADVAFSGVLPNGALYTAPVQSMREGRYANLVRQQTDYSCGAASLATILRYAYRLDADEGTVIERGRHEELLAANGLYAELYRTQFAESEAVVR